MAAYDPARSPEPRTNSDDEGESLRDSHDLSLANARHRASLLDNLLLSFDKIGDGIGPFGGPETSPFFSTVDEVDDNASIYSRHSRQARTGSVGAATAGYSLQYPQRVRPDQDFGYEEEGGSFGVTYGASDRDLRSRTGRGIDSSHGSFGGGYPNAFEYDSAPAPSIRTRNRTPSPPRSPRVVRRPSNRSIKSLHQNPALQPPEHFALPPLPAFANPPPPVGSPMATTSKPSRPGFFRRVFGGGNSNTSGTSSNPKTPTSASSGNPPSTPPARGVIAEPLPPPPPPLPQVVTKKSSFFRRRKKSVSDANQHPMPSLPLPPINTDAPPNIDFDGPRTSSLRNAMKPYIPSPSWNPENYNDLRPPSFPAQGATIRAVASSEAVAASRQSPLSGDSPQRPNGTYGSAPDMTNKYKKDGWNSRGGTANGERSPLGMNDGGRPSPSQDLHALNRTFFEDDDDEREYMWPQPPARVDVGRQIVKTQENKRPQNPSKPASADSFKDFPIFNMAEYERQCAEEEKRLKRKAEQEKAAEQQEKDDKEEEREQKAPELNLDTSVRLPRAGIDQSWFLSTTSPLTTSTPTVTLQRDGQQSVVLDQEDEASRKDSDHESLKEGEFTSKDLDIAHKIFDGNEELVTKEKAAAWLGDPGPGRGRIRKAYMSLFDWAGMNILASMRLFCGRLVFKGEAQQVDRIMDDISQRWCQCNPNHGFKNSDIVHTILYSVLLLNTDLHMAEISNSQRMTRGQFLKNTMATIRRVLEDAPSELTLVKTKTKDEDKLTLSGTRSPIPFPDDDDETQLSALQSMTFPMPANHKHSKRPSLDFGRGSRMSRIGNLSPRLPTEDNDKDLEMDGAVALVKAPISGGIKVWETQVEIVLKEFYQSIKAQALPLHGSADAIAHPQNNTLSVFGSAGGMLRRSPSTISKAPSELSVAGRQREIGGKSSKDWSMKNRSRQRVYNGSYAGSSRTSLEDRSSLWSPSASSTWSKYSLNKTQTSMSVDSLGSIFTQNDYQQSIGFANALSHAIIREEAASGHSGEEGNDLDVLLDGDDELELAGAPWAKEGLLKHKHHLEGTEKRAKNRNWTESFAVIQRGYMRLFQFPSRTSNKSNSQAVHGVVGGGNWTENAEPIGVFQLRQTIASALPPPGYSKARPHVWALSLPTGAVHFFEVGTAEIVKEFVTTANYWSARLSKEPLTGGVSNVEYGWSENVIDLESLGPASPPQSRNSELPQGRPSLQISIRSSFDQSGGFRPRLPGDKVNIKDWTPPTQSMVASNLKESDQLRALESYVSYIESDLTRHNELRNAVTLAFSPRHPNYTKALNNWEQKSKYLLKEIIKFRTYIETLQAAIAKRQVLSAERLKVPSLAGDEEKRKRESAVDLDTAPEPNKVTG